MAARVVVVGSANTDLCCLVDRLPAPGETVLGGRFFTAAGGKGANQAVAAARLGAEVTFIARVGDDDHGRAALAGYRAEGLNVDHVTVSGTAASGVALIMIERGGENLIAVAPGANAELAPEHVVAAGAAIAAADALLLQLEVPLPAVCRAAELAAAAGTPVVLNPAPMPAGGLPTELLARVSYLTPNETEAARLASSLQQPGGPALIITRGAAGAVIQAGGETLEVPSPAVEAVDAVGAGDAFSAAFCVGLAEGRPLAEAVARACAAGALTACREGAQPALPTRRELDEFLAGRR